jgi:hypothetical protein
MLWSVHFRGAPDALPRKEEKERGEGKRRRKEEKERGEGKRRRKEEKERGGVAYKKMRNWHAVRLRSSDPRGLGARAAH